MFLFFVLFGLILFFFFLSLFLFHCRMISVTRSRIKDGEIWRVTSVIFLYWIVSLSLIFVNKHILSGSFGNYDMSIFVAWYQCCIASIMIFLAGLVFNFMKWSFQIPTVHPKTLLEQDILILSYTFVGGLTLNNLMLKHISVAFYQVARSFTLVFTVMLSVYILCKPFTRKVLLCCFLVIGGFSLSVKEEDVSGTLSLWGILYGIVASFFVALCGIYLKKGEKIVMGDTLKLTYCNSINGAIIFIPLIYSSGQLSMVLNSPTFYDPWFWIFLTCSGLLSLGIGWASALQIKYTSPVTHHISINAKSVVQTIMAVLYFQEQKSFLWWCGNLLVVSGIMVYAYEKIYSNENEKVRSPLPPISSGSSHSNEDKNEPSTPRMFYP